MTLASSVTKIVQKVMRIASFALIVFLRKRWKLGARACN